VIAVFLLAQRALIAGIDTIDVDVQALLRRPWRELMARPMPVRGRS